MHIEQIDEVLTFWLGPDPGDPERLEPYRARWFESSTELDRDIERRFGDLVEAGAEGRLEQWEETPRGALALVVTLDQFPRNIHRGSPRAFACDARALATMERAIERRHDERLREVEAIFLYMPTQHSEELDVQRRGVRLYERLLERASHEFAAQVEQTLAYAKRHLAIIERFGRFPHRNRSLGRESTPQEDAYLRSGGETFGQ